MESLKKLLRLEINLTLPALIAIAVWFALTIIVATTKYIGYISGDYYLQTGNSRRKVRGNRGLSGEYFIYKRLKKARRTLSFQPLPAEKRRYNNRNRRRDAARIGNLRL